MEMEVVMYEKKYFFHVIALLLLYRCISPFILNNHNNMSYNVTIFVFLISYTEMKGVVVTITRQDTFL